MGWEYVSELLPLKGILLIPQMIWVGERRWNDTDRGKSKNSEKDLSQYHFVHHKFHMDWHGREPEPPLMITMHVSYTNWSSSSGPA
jgi:hypothetical protein